jgi:hypothetical protein
LPHYFGSRTVLGCGAGLADAGALRTAHGVTLGGVKFWVDWIGHSTHSMGVVLPTLGPNATQARCATYMPLSLAFETPGLIVVRANGALGQVEMAQARKQVSHFLQEVGEGQCLICLESEFAGFETPDGAPIPDAADRDDLVHQQVIHQYLNRLAVVGDLRWRDNARVFLLDSVVPYPIEYFPRAQEAFARAWLAN